MGRRRYARRRSYKKRSGTSSKTIRITVHAGGARRRRRA
jgi:hypothetical protein